MNAEESWFELLPAIEQGACIPFIGAGASCPPLPTANDLLRTLCGLFSVPPWAAADLSTAAEFIQIAYGREALLEAVGKEIAREQVLNDAHLNLAALPWHTLVTTNYDVLLSSALSAAGRRVAVVSLPSPRDPVNRIEEPSVAAPLVVHVHGALPTLSEIVIAESDYYRYLANMASGVWELPRAVQYGLASSSYLFVGYSVRDWTFRLLFYSLQRFFRRDHFALIFLPGKPNKETKYMVSYLQQFVRAYVFFGDAQSFTFELRQRWEDYAHELDLTAKVGKEER